MIRSYIPRASLTVLGALVLAPQLVAASPRCESTEFGVPKGVDPMGLLEESQSELEEKIFGSLRLGSGSSDEYKTLDGFRTATKSLKKQKRLAWTEYRAAVATHEEAQARVNDQEGDLRVRVQQCLEAHPDVDVDPMNFGSVGTYLSGLADENDTCRATLTEYLQAGLERTETKIKLKVAAIRYLSLQVYIDALESARATERVISDYFDEHTQVVTSFQDGPFTDWGTTEEWSFDQPRIQQYFTLMRSANTTRTEACESVLVLNNISILSTCTLDLSTFSNNSLIYDEEVAGICHDRISTIGSLN